MWKNRLWWTGPIALGLGIVAGHFMSTTVKYVVSGIGLVVILGLLVVMLLKGSKEA